MMIKKDVDYTKKIVQSGLFISLAIIIRNFSYMVYFGGAPGMRIGFSGIFIHMPAILFGPLYGGIASGILDVLGYMLKPDGAYIPWLTVTAIAGGIITGYIWKIFKNINTELLQKKLFTIFIVVFAVGVINHISVAYFPNTFWSHSVMSIGKNRDLLTFGLEGVSIAGIGLLAIDIMIQKKYRNLFLKQFYLKLITAIGASEIVVTVFNTFILQMFIPSLGKKGFIILLIPRLFEGIFVTVIQAYIISLLLSIYRKIEKDKI
ncbi:MAG: ECF transporter S component [Clostridiales bacterium]|nr:ECF transporter S component [Clostridiales bacterium]